MIFNLVLCLTIIFLYSLTHLGGRTKAAKDRIFLLVTFVILFVLVASREFTIGNDTSSYLKLYNDCNTYKWGIFARTNYYEPGYLMFNILLSYLHVSPRFFIVILASFFNFAIYRFIKENSNNYLMSALLYVNLMYFYQSMTMMRQFFALSIVLLIGYELIKKKMLLGYMAVILLASLFHVTALFAIFIYPLYHMKYSGKTVGFLIVGAITSAILLNQIYPLVATFLGKEAFYVGMLGEAKLGNLIAMLIFLSMYAFSLTVIKPVEYRKFSFYLYMLLFATLIYFVSINMAVLSRSAQYYAIFSIIALPNIIGVHMKKSKILVESVIVGLFMCYSSIVMIYKPEWNSAYNYKTCLLAEEGYICE